MEKYYFENCMDKQILYLINNFIDEFESIFGKYLNRDEVINRIENNMNDFCFSKIEEKNIYGKYNINEKRVIISCDVDEKNLKEIVFHEMIHCITSKDNNISFTYKNIFGEVINARGFTEGFAQLATVERNKKYNKDGKFVAYPILTEQVENFAKIIGKDDFYYMAFNCPDKISDLAKEKGLIEDEIDIQIFLDAFDEILIKEKEIYKSKSTDGNLYKKIFGFKDDFRSRLTIAKNEIIDFYIKTFKSKDIYSVEELNKMFNQLNLYVEQLDNKDTDNIYDIVIDKLDNLINQNIINSDNYDMINDEFKKIYSQKKQFNEFMNLSPQQKLQQLSNIDQLNWLLSSNFEDKYQTLITESIFIGENSSLLFEYLINGLSKLILDKKYDISKLSFEIIDFSGIYGEVINLYEHSLKNKKYLCTLNSINDNYELIEMEPQSRTKASFDFEDEFGNIFKYDKNKNHSFVIKDRNNMTINSIGITYIKSNLESFYLFFIKYLNRYNKGKEEGYPEVLLRDTEKLYNNYSQTVQSILEEKISLKELIDLEKSYKELGEKEIDRFFDEK